MKRIALVLMGMLVVGIPLFASGTQGGGASTASDGLTVIKAWGLNKEYTVSGQSIKFSDWYDGKLQSRLWEQFQAEMTKKGVKLQLDLIMTDQIETAFQTLLASGRLNDYDWISPSGLDEKTRLSLVAQNRLYPLNQAIAQYSDGPAKAYFANDPAGKFIVKTQTLEDGNFYWFPQAGLSSHGTNSVGTSIMGQVRKDWLDKLGLAVPKTPDEFYNALLAFQQQDVNGNGIRDEVASAAIDSFDSGISQWFGLGNSLVSSLDNQAVSPWYQPHIRDYFTYMNRLYRAGLLLVNSEGNDMAANKVGFHNTYSADTWSEPGVNVPAGAPKAYFIPLVLQAASDIPLRAYNDGGVGIYLGSGLYSIPRGSKNIEKAVKMIDYLVSDAYSVLNEWGIEGYTFTSQGGIRKKLAPNSGNVGLDMDLIFAGLPSLWSGYSGVFPRRETVNRMEDHLLIDDMAKTLGYPQGNPERAKFIDDFGNGVYKFVQGLGSVRAFPTAKEVDRIAEITPDLTTYSTELITALILGEKSQDNWNAYMADLKRLGLDELITINQARIDRAK